MRVARGFTQRAKPVRTPSPTLKAIFDHCDSIGMTQYELADLIDGSQAMISGYRLGKHTPSITVVEAICDAAGLEIVIQPVRTE